MPHLRELSKAALVTGTVKPWHVIVILVVGWAVGLVAAAKLARAFDPSIRLVATAVMANSIANAIYIAYIAAVPEFRHALRFLFARPRVPVRASQFAWAVAVTMCWGYGLYRIAVLLPVLAARPDLYEALRFGEHVAPLDVKSLLWLWLIGAVCAPIGEELMFRGFLMNLWLQDKGPWFAIIGSSLLFGAFHGADAVFAGAAGVVFALVYLRYESLWPGIALHGLYNFTSPAWVLGWLVSLKPRAEATEPSHWILEGVLGLLFFPAAWQFWRRFRPGAA